MLDLLIQNGRVIDPFSGTDEVLDIGIQGDRIVPAVKEATYKVNAKGCLVLPGLIDFHAHIFSSGSSLSVPADLATLPFGVTTIVDAGTSGAANFPAFRTIASLQSVEIKALLNVASAGICSSRFHENVDPKTWERDRIVRILKENRGFLLGLKVRISRDVVLSLGLEPLLEAIALAEEIGDWCKVVVHVTDPPESLACIAEILRPGDVFCHVYHGTGMTILKDGSVLPALREARSRGVIFDAANGNGHFAFKIARRALEDGFAPDIISTDLTTLTMNKTRAVGLPYLMSKYLHLGVNLSDVVKAVTLVPAQNLEMAGEIGTLATGSRADVAILKIIEAPVKFEDTLGICEYGSLMLLPKMTISKGKMLYRALDFDY